jgi:TPR repeat protein
MKANRLAFMVLLSAAAFQLPAQKTETDEKPLEARAGDVESEFQLGFRYGNGEGVAKNQVEAAKWLRKAAEQNHAEAQYLLGLRYYAGFGVANDYLIRGSSGGKRARCFVGDA